jgi:primosomal protein N' (replication factor Y)
MDMDTTRGKGAHQKLLGEFARGNGHILLGTQMIAKGLDFERVTLVGVVNADAGLHYPDFRARERTFQLVYQVSGRSGRGIYPGRVVIQTWLPEDLAIKSATQRNLKQFYNLELSDRNQLNYPPFARIASLGFLGRDRDRVVQACDAAAARLRKVEDIQLLGPSPALIERTPRGYYWKIILKSSKTSDAMGVKLRQAVAGISRGWKNRDVRLSVDMDPYQLL